MSPRRAPRNCPWAGVGSQLSRGREAAPSFHGFPPARAVLAFTRSRIPRETTERPMIRYVVATVMAGAALVSGAHAQALDTEGNRYQFNQVQDGYLRLDLKSGAVSLCSRGEAGWSCLAVPDDRAAFEAEIARLQGENVALKKALIDRGLPLPGGVTAPPPVAQNGGSDLKLPSDAEIDRAMTMAGKMWRRLLEMMQ